MYNKPMLVEFGRIGQVVRYKIFKRRDWLGLNKNWLPF